MTPQAKGRFCASCATTVVDFSQFTDKQLLDYFGNISGKTCGRFSDSQLNRAVYAETLPKQNFFPRALAAAALFLGISSQTQAQHYFDHPTPAGQIVEKKAAGEETPAKTVGKTPEKVSGADLVIEGKLLDSESKEGIPFTTIVIKETKIYSQTDIEGYFKIIVPDTLQLKELVLIAASIGYESKEILISEKEMHKTLNIHLKSLPVIGELIVCSVRKTPAYYFRSFWWKTKNLFQKND
ncbi:carboxypeptidase-like regulatory domain-containing protein [Adhaeribacter terreus]|uniref:Carboxypeptidase-like regulatory domain-containing protein n=1 Tax=Adhaeribacter terreus TaxID=529703 RepID=A0ABW0E867_9BACT